MKRTPKRYLHKWIQKYPVPGRAVLVVIILVSPVVLSACILWEERDKIISATSDLCRAAFLPWTDE